MRKALALLLLLTKVSPAASGQPSEFGGFSGKPQTEWSDDGRYMTLLRDFSYDDQDGKKWTALKGSEVVGASIPQAFWWLIGGPFEGKYRSASIVHDTECTAPYKKRLER